MFPANVIFFFFKLNSHYSFLNFDPKQTNYWFEINCTVNIAYKVIQ